MGVREFQGDFESGTHGTQDAGTLPLPDAILATPLHPFAPGPIAQSDTSSGLVVRSWYARVDNAAGEVYLARANDANDGWDPETLLFAFTGTAWLTADLAFDQNGRAMLCGQRGADVWIWFFDTSLGSFALTNFGSGVSPRCLLDQPLDVTDSDIVVFYLSAAGALKYRLQRNRYLTEYDAGVALTPEDRLVGRFRGTGNRFHLIYATHDPITGKWSDPKRLSSGFYPYVFGDAAVPSATAVSGTIRVLVLTELMELEELEGLASGVSGLLASIVTDVAFLEGLSYGVSVAAVSRRSVIVSSTAALEELEPAALGVSGDMVVIVIVYNNATPEEIEPAASGVSGTLAGDMPTTGLYGHWKADALALADLDPVASWPDSGPNAYDLVQATGSVQPQFRTAQVNGLPAVDFDDVDHLDLAAAPAPGGAGVTLWFVLENPADNLVDVMSWNTGLANRFGALLPYSDGKFYFDHGNALGGGRISGTKPLGYPGAGFRIFELHKPDSSGGSAYVSMDGTVVFTGAFTDALDAGSFTLKMGKGPNAGFTGKIAEAVIFSTPQSLADRDQTRAYLAAKYGITVP